MSQPSCCATTTARTARSPTRAPKPSSMEDVHARFIRALEQQGDLKREVERLPNEEELLDRRAAGIGLTVPELAVLLAYAKIDLEDDDLGVRVTR